MITRYYILSALLLLCVDAISMESRPVDKLTDLDRRIQQKQREFNHVYGRISGNGNWSDAEFTQLLYVIFDKAKLEKEKTILSR
jgi:hypothetical protein